MLAARRLPASGAQDLVDFGAMQSYYPGFVDRADKKDKLPGMDTLQAESENYGALCRAGGLRAIDDISWWRDSACSPDATEFVRSAEAAECLLRMPWLLSDGRCGPAYEAPQPAAGIEELLGAVNALTKWTEEMRDDAEAEIGRRRGRLLYIYTRRRGAADPTGLTVEELRLLKEYEKISKVEEDKKYSIYGPSS